MRLGSVPSARTAFREPPSEVLAHLGARPGGEDCGTGRIRLVEVGRQERDEPVLDLFEGTGVEPVVAVLTVFTHAHQAVVAQHLEVLRDGRLAEPEALDHLADADLAALRVGGDVPLEEHLQQVAPRPVRDHVEDVRHAPTVVATLREYHVAGCPYGGEAQLAAIPEATHPGQGGCLRRGHPGPLRHHASSRALVLVFTGPVLAADRHHVRPAGTAGRRAVHGRVRDLRDRPLDRGHGHVLVADRARVRVHRSGDRRRRGADRRIHPRSRHRAQARAPPEAAGRRRREPAPHPQGTDLREPGREARRDRRSAHHRRGQRARDRGDRRDPAVPPDAAGRRPGVRRRVAVGVPLGDGVHQHRVPADDGGADTVRGRRLLPHGAHARRVLRRDRVPGHLRTRPQPPPAQTLVAAREAHPRDVPAAAGGRSGGLLLPRVQQRTHHGKHGCRPAHPAELLHLLDGEIRGIRDPRHGSARRVRASS